MLRTSETHPLIINEIPVAKGMLGLTFCPGKKQETSLTGGWNRDVRLDIKALEDWGTTHVISLLESHEYIELGVRDLPQELWMHFNWMNMPITDKCAPTTAWVKRWEREVVYLAARLNKDAKIVIHCKGGFGRTGTVAALILMHFGHTVDEAVAKCREARENAVENDIQMNFLRSYKI